MPSPVVRTKLYVPRNRPGRVPRPRLDDLLVRAPRPRLALVSAPPGFGKTTLLTAWAGTSAAAGRAVAWVSLEDTERDPATFWTHVVTALDGAAAGLGAAVLPLLEGPDPAVGTVLAHVLNGLGELSGGLDLVLDDYHLADGPALAADVEFLLLHLPPEVCLVVGTRADPALPLARLRSRGELVEVRAADLRFTPAEVATYLDRVPGLELGAEDVAALEGRTEGWVAALQLAALSLRGREDASRVHRGVRRRRPVRRRLPRRGGHRPAAGDHPALPPRDLGPRPAQRPAVRRRHRAHRRAGGAGADGAREPPRRAARRHPPLVPLPPPLRRRAALPPRGRRDGPARGAAPPRGPVVRRRGRPRAGRAARRRGRRRRARRRRRGGLRHPHAPGAPRGVGEPVGRRPPGRGRPPAPGARPRSRRRPHVERPLRGGRGTGRGPPGGPRRTARRPRRARAGRPRAGPRGAGDLPGRARPGAGRPRRDGAARRPRPGPGRPGGRPHRRRRGSALGARVVGRPATSRPPTAATPPRWRGCAGPGATPTCSAAPSPWPTCCSPRAASGAAPGHLRGRAAPGRRARGRRSVARQRGHARRARPGRPRAR